MIKIVSGISLPGGLTQALINLCNLFNLHGYQCIYYAPHKWHLARCQSGTLDQATYEKDDIILANQLQIDARPNVRQFVLTCHSTVGYPIKTMNYHCFDLLHFVSEKQKEWHGVDHPSVVIPNLLNPMRPSARMPDGHQIAAVIGSVSPHKQTHISIQRALDNGCDLVLLFGTLLENHKAYFMDKIQPLIHSSTGKVRFMGFEDDRQKIYDSVDVVYHSSKSETFNYVIAECQQTGTRYDGLDSAETNAELLSDDEILEKWKGCLDI